MTWAELYSEAARPTLEEIDAMRIRPFGRSCARIWRRPMERDRGWSTAGAVWSRDGM